MDKRVIIDSIIAIQGDLKIKVKSLKEIFIQTRDQELRIQGKIEGVNLAIEDIRRLLNLINEDDSN